MNRLPAMTPELLVQDWRASVQFYCEVLGFIVLYQREEEGFAALTLGEAALMLEQMPTVQCDDPWIVTPLDAPLGRGINLQISVDDLASLLRRLESANWPLRMPVQQHSYRVGLHQLQVHELMLQDPDGYLLRFSQRINAVP